MNLINGKPKTDSFESIRHRILVWASVHTLGVALC